MIRFTVPGRIGGKGRPKFSTRGGFVRAYTPAATRNMEAMVRDFGEQAMNGRPALQGPLGLSIHIIQAPAQSWSFKRKRSTFWVTGKPDLDNIVKLAGDSLNGVIWHDDSQIAALSVERRYSLTEPERVEIAVYPLLDGTWHPPQKALPLIAG